MNHHFLFELDAQFLYNTALIIFSVILSLAFFFLLFYVIYKGLRKPASIPVNKVEHTKKDLSAILKEARMNHHYTQEYVAELLGVSRQTVSKWENGSSEPTMANLQELIKLYHLDPNALF